MLKYGEKDEKRVYPIDSPVRWETVRTWSPFGGVRVFDSSNGTWRFSLDFKKGDNLECWKKNALTQHQKHWIKERGFFKDHSFSSPRRIRPWISNWAASNKNLSKNLTECFKSYLSQKSRFSWEE